MTTNMIPIEKIRPCPFVDRLSADPPELFSTEKLQEVPVYVVQSLETNLFFIVKNLSIYAELIQHDVKEVLCIIENTVSSDKEAYAKRLAHVLEDHKPFHILEQCCAIYQCEAHLIEGEGADAFFKNGGDRRSNKFRKKRLSVEICNLLPYKPAKIDILKRFGKCVGYLGIQGLYEILIEKDVDLSINQIHSKNAQIKAADILSEIEKQKKYIPDNAKLRRNVGMMLYRIIFDDNEDDSDGNGDVKADSENIESYDENELSQIQNSLHVNSNFQPLTSESIERIQEVFEKLLNYTEDGQEFLYEFEAGASALDTEEFFDIVKKVQQALIAFFEIFYKEIRWKNG